MPYKRKTTRRGSKSYRKKRTSRRRHKKTSLHTMMRSKDLICADMYFTKLRYIDTDSPYVNLWSGYPYYGGMLTYGAYAAYTLNGLYDANILVSSTAVPGFSQITPLYSAYRVLSATITCTYFNTSTVYNMTAFMWAYTQVTAVAPPSLSITPAEVRQLEGNKFVKQCELDSSGAGNASRTMKMRVNFPSLYDSPSYQYDITTAGTATTNPPFKIYLINGAVSGNLGAFSANIYCNCKTTIEYNCVFFNRANTLF